MARLIDADAYLAEWKTAVEMARRVRLEETDSLETMYFEIAKDLERQPTVDAVEVVRCRECKHYDRGSCNGNQDICSEEEYWFYVKPDDFCSYGERKDND